MRETTGDAFIIYHINHEDQVTNINIDNIHYFDELPSPCTGKKPTGGDIQHLRFVISVLYHHKAVLP